MAERYCTHCGTKIPEGARFCPVCGAPVEEPQPADRHKQGHRHTIIFVMTVIGISLVVCLGTYLFLRSKNHPNSASSEAPVIETAEPEETEETDDTPAESTEEAVVTAAPEPAETQESTYLLPDSDTRRITASDLSGMSAQDLTYARNEIYARHGKVFQHNELNRYFQTKSWYHADPSFQDTMTSPLEQTNAGFILQYQKDNGLEYMPGN